MTAKKIYPIVTILVLLGLLLSSCATFKETTASAIQQVKTSKLLNELVKPEAKTLSASSALNKTWAPIPRESPEKAKATTERVLAKGIPAMKVSKGVSGNILDPVPYWQQAGTPSAIQGFAHPESGCNWLGVAGQVFDVNGTPAPNVVVNVGGSLSGIAISMLGLTGTTDAYGPASYEVALATIPQASHNTLWVQLSDLSGKAVSRQIYFDTYATCDKNLTIINFFEVTGSYAILLPMVSNGQ